MVFTPSDCCRRRPLASRNGNGGKRSLAVLPRWPRASRHCRSLKRKSDRRRSSSAPTWIARRTFCAETSADECVGHSHLHEVSEAQIDVRHPQDRLEDARVAQRPTQHVMPVKPSDYLRGTDDPTVWTGRALQAESSKWQWLVLRFCIRPLRGADRSWPSWISARVRSHSEIGPRRPVGSPDHERDGETVLHSSNPTRRPRRVSPISNVL
jgi:hypothetical protein